jgi:hypothetical protein
MSPNKVKSEKGLWLFATPVNGLVLSEDIGQEITINEITFISNTKLPYVRKRLGFPMTIGELKKKKLLGSFFEQSNVYAIGKLGGSGVEKEKEFLKTVRNELNIISLSQLSYKKRRVNACLSIADEVQPGSLEYFMMNTKKGSYVMSNKLSGKFMTLTLDHRWKKFQTFSYYFELLDLFRGEINVSDKWRRDIQNAALLAGQSQSTSNLPQAFLWNMFAIETLLTHQGDSYSKTLPKRVEAFIGWTTNWSDLNYEEKIRKVYAKRCKFVHAGQSDNISKEDLFFTDTILFNVFYNILKHIDLYPDKEALIAFSERVRAEHILGIKPKVRPKTMRFLAMNYSDKDYEDI